MQYIGVSLGVSVPFLIGLFFGICIVYLLAGVGSKTNRVIQSSGREIICSVHAYFQQEYEAGGSKIPLQRIEIENSYK